MGYRLPHYWFLAIWVALGAMVVLSSDSAAQLGGAPTPTPCANCPPPGAGSCSCICPAALGNPQPQLSDYERWSCPAPMFDSCDCDPQANGTECGYVSEAMIKYDFYQQNCLAWLNSNCPCPNPDDPNDNRTPRSANQCCPLPAGNGCPGVQCPFTKLFDCGPICAFFGQFFSSVCDMLQDAVQDGQEHQCVTLSASAGGASSSITLCCPEGSHVSGCSPWNGDGGELNGQCEVLFPNSGCLAVSYICRCPGMSISCTPDGEPPPTPLPTVTPTSAPTATAVPTVTVQPSPTPTPTEPPGGTPTPGAGKKVYLRE